MNEQELAIKAAAQALGRKGGSAKSERKTASARLNWQKARAALMAKREAAKTTDNHLTTPAHPSI